MIGYGEFDVTEFVGDTECEKVKTVNLSLKDKPNGTCEIKVKYTFEKFGKS